MQPTVDPHDLKLIEKNMNHSTVDLGKVWCPRLIFKKPGVAPLDVALYGAIAMMQKSGMVVEEGQPQKLHTAALTLEILRLTLNLPANKKSALKESLLNLYLFGIIQVISLVPDSKAQLAPNDNTQLNLCDWVDGWFCVLMPIRYDIEPNCAGFCQLDIADWEHIKLELTKPSDLIKGFAAYIAIQRFIYHSKNAQPICYQTQGQLGASYGVKRYSVSRTVQQLHEIWAIVMCKVLWNHNGELIERNVMASARDDQAFHDYMLANLGTKYVRVLQ